MRKSLSALIAALGVGAASLFAPVSAQAALVEKTFTLAPDFGPLAGLSEGSFAFDDALAPTVSPFGDQLFALSAFTLDIGGQVYGLGDLDEAFAAFDASGFTGLVVSIDGVLTLSPALGPLDAFFAHLGGDGESAGAVRFADVPGGTVGEPGAAALALLALAALGARRARRRRL